MAPRRLPSSPQEAVPFRCGGRACAGVPGDSVASALLASGHTVLARSVKYHRPRSYLCGVGKCANCLVTIDGKPSQRACMVPLRAGMDVRFQNAWPSPRFDLFAAADRMFARGFDPQRSFTRPGFLIPLYHQVVRRMAGLGQAPRDAAPPRTGPVAREEARLVVVGGGPAGLAAAWEAVRAGIAVQLYDEQPWPGGRLAWEEGALQGPEPFAGMAPRDALAFLEHELPEEACERSQRANVAGFYGDRLLAIQTPQRLVEVRAQAVVLATGAPESLPLFGDNDRPGIMGGAGAAILLRRHAILPGQRVVLVGADARARDLARGLQRAGAAIEALVSESGEAPEGLRGVRGRPHRALGTAWVTDLEVEDGGQVRARLPCDLVVFTEPRRPAVELAQQAGCTLASRGRGVLGVKADDGATSRPGVFAAGDVVRPGSLEAALASGRVAGLRAAQAAGAKVDEARLARAAKELELLRGAP